MRKRSRAALFAWSAVYGLSLLGLFVGGYAVSSRVMAARRRRPEAFTDPTTATWYRVHRATRRHTSLHDAVRWGDTLAVAGYLLAGADVNAVDRINQTPLHRAALWGHDEVAGMLIDAGADVHARGNGGQTPLHNVMISALSCGEPMGGLESKRRTITMLVWRGADPNARDRNGWTPLHVGAAHLLGRDTPLLATLVALGADVNARDNEGRTPLHVAVRSWQSHTAAVLVEHGASRTARDTAGEPALPPRRRTARAAAPATSAGPTAF